MKTRIFISCVSAIAFLLTVASDTFAQAKPSRRDLATLQRLNASFQDLVQQVRPAIVQVLTAGYAPVDGDTPGVVASQHGTGSGVILDRDGYIVTNAHVVEGARKVQVLLAANMEESDLSELALNPRGKTVPAQIVGIDTDTDLAVLKVEQKNLPFLELGDSYRLHQGQLVLAFGNPLGLENSVTMGVVSSVARQIRSEDPMVYIQTDAPINPGNSGGALVGTDGKVVGINSFILTQSGGSEGLGFAIPSNIVRNIYTQLKKDGHVHRGQIGLEVQTVTPTMAAGLRLPRDWGIIVSDVTPDGTADEAGLKVGDLILSIDGKIVENARRFDVTVYQHALGDVVSLEIQRGDKKLTLPVTVTERPNDPYRFVDLVTRESNLIPKLGIFALDFSDKLADLLPDLRQPSGVIVAARVAGATGIQETFLPGDLIDAINTAPVSDIAGLRAAVDKLKSGDPVVVQIQRSSKLMYLSFELP